jgi:hypothetical protein
MRGNIFRKILIILLVVVPALSDSGCKKQPKCGCDGDVLFSLIKEPATIYFNPTGTSITFSTLAMPYDQYNFCNPGEMFPKLKDSKSGDQLEVTGKVFWECNYLYQTSNSSYQSPYKVYMIQVSDVASNPYGKK